MGEMNRAVSEDGSSPLLGLEAIERELAAAGARSGSPDPHPASPFLASLEEQPELQRGDEPGAATAEMAVATLVDAEEDMAEVDGFVDQLGDRAGLGLVEEDEELLVGVSEQLLVEGEEEGQATGPPEGVSPLAVQAAKQWDAQDRPKAWQGRVYGLVVHTTGGGLPAKARDKGVYPTVLAIDHYNQTHGCHYVNGWRGVEGGDLLQVANEREQAAGVAVTNPKYPHIDQRRSIERSRFEADLPADLVTRWRARWPGYKHSLELLPGTRTANSCYLHVECVPCVFAYDGKLVSAAEPLRPGLRFTRAQHDSVALLACDVARRNGWPHDQRWWRSPRLLGHEDLTPISRHTSTGGWDPGYLRKDPYFDWDYVYQAIERLQYGAGAGPTGPVGARASAERSGPDHQGDGPWSGERPDEALPGDLEAGLPDAVAIGQLNQPASAEGVQDESFLGPVYDAARRIFVQPLSRIVDEYRRWERIRADVARIAGEEWKQHWSSGSVVESDPAVRPRLVAYWAAAGITHSGSDVWERAWSAAFVSWVLRHAGVGVWFPYSARHDVYVHGAIRAVQDPANPVKAFPADKVRPRVGDLVVNWRGTKRSYQNLLALTSPPASIWTMHGDIVTAVDPSRGRIEVIGGNKAPAAGAVCASGNPHDGCSVNRSQRLIDGNGLLQPLNASDRDWVAVVRVGWGW
jgi:hypothetical protein